MADKITFSFGKNWQEFLENVDETKIREASESLTEFLEMDDLNGKTFLDIGNGSGIYSLSALRLGAEKVRSFDLDPFSVKCVEHLHKEEGQPENWTTSEGSALDQDFMNSLDTYDIVYSWGVLHHTGKMWDAIRNAAERVNDGGYFYITLYNTVDGIFGSKWWLFWKKLYNRHPFLGKYIMEPLYVAGKFLIKPLKLQNPFSIIKNYKHKYRGMSWRRDITDWLGGYPYEFATVEEVFKFMKKEFPQFTLVNLKNSNYMRPNWFLFKNEAQDTDHQ